jgi:hypothetical protein
MNLLLVLVFIIILCSFMSEKSEGFDTSLWEKSGCCGPGADTDACVTLRYDSTIMSYSHPLSSLSEHHLLIENAIQEQCG